MSDDPMVIEDGMSSIKFAPSDQVPCRLMGPDLQGKVIPLVESSKLYQQACASGGDAGCKYHAACRQVGMEQLNDTSARQQT